MYDDSHVFYGQFNLLLFALAVVNLAVLVSGLLLPSAAVRCAVLPTFSIVLTLLIAFVGFDSREQLYRSALATVYAVPHSADVAERIQRFGLAGEHPILTRSSWMLDISEDRTQDSYWQWVTAYEMRAAALCSKQQ